MAEKVLKDCKLLVGGYDLSGDSNEITVTVSADILDKTGFGSSFRKKKPGLKSVEIAGGGFWSASSDSTSAQCGFDERLFPKVGDSSAGGSSQILTVAADNASSSPALLTKGIGASYGFGGSIGELMSYNFAAQGDGPAVWGKLLQTSTMGSAETNSSGYGSIVNLGKGTTIYQRIYAVAHIIRGCSGASQTFNLQIQASSVATFAGSPSTVCGFTQLKTTDHHVRASWGATYASTDQGYYRVVWKGSGAGVTHRAIVAMGIDRKNKR